MHNSSLGVGTLGVVSLSAHAVATQFLSVAFLGAFGIGVSLSIRLGHTLPVDVKRAKCLVEYTTLASCFVFALASCMLYIVRHSIYCLFTANADVVAKCDEIWFMVCIYFFLLSWFALNTGIANGLGMQWHLGRITFVLLWCFGVPALFYFGVHVYESLGVIWNCIYPPYAFINVSLVYTFLTTDWDAISASICGREMANNFNKGIIHRRSLNLRSATYGSLDDEERPLV
jgi:Na+-driven multidrug efflux pump